MGKSICRIGCLFTLETIALHLLTSAPFNSLKRREENALREP